MKRHLLFSWVLVVSLMLVGIPASANGQDAQAEPEEEKPLAGWDNGFYIKSKDDQFKMKINGRVQTKFETQKISGLQKPAGGRATLPADTFSDSFSLRRGRIQTMGTLFGKVDWVTILTATTRSTTADPRIDFWGWATYNVAPSFMITTGVIQLPMDRMGENSSAWLLTIEPGLTATQSDGVKDLTIARDSFGLPLDLGLRIDGDVGKYFSYALGASNGGSFRNLNANNELSYGGRLQFNVLGDAVPFKETDFDWSEKPRLSIGAGTGWEDHDAADENTPAVTRRWSWSSSGDLAFRWRGFSLNSEAYYRILKLSASTVEDTNADRKLKDIGYYASAGYYVIPHKLELSLLASQIFREVPDNNGNEFGGGINWYIHKNNVKFQLDYTNVLDYDDVAGLNNATYHRVRAMFSTFL